MGGLSNKVESFDSQPPRSCAKNPYPATHWARRPRCPLPDRDVISRVYVTVEISMWLPSRFALLLTLDTMAAGILCKGLESERLAIQSAAGKHKKHRDNNNK